MRMAWRPRTRVGQSAVVGVLALVTLTLLLLTLFRLTPQPSSAVCASDPLSRQADSQQLQRYFSPRPQPVTEVVSRFLLQPHPAVCGTPLDLLVLVPSPPHSARVRDTIRNTWGSVTKGDWPHGTSFKWRVALFFLLGRGADGKTSNLTTLRREAESHGDLLVGDFHDTYRNLTCKMLAGLLWLSRHCLQVSYVLKADQDTFVHMQRLMDILSHLRDTQSISNAVLGEMLCSETVNRDPSNPVWVEASVYPFPVFPTYVRGGSYILGGSLVSRLVNTSRYMPYLPVEDAFINGVLARTLHVQHVHLPHVLTGLVCPLSPCVFLASGQVTATNVGVDMMQDMWRAVQAGPDHCCKHTSWLTSLCVWASTKWV